MQEAFLVELKKIAALRYGDYKLHPHQEEAVKFFDKNRRVLLAHATGSGKTLTAIAAFERLKAKGKANRALVITPAALQSNFKLNGIDKFTDSSYGVPGSKADYELISLEKFRKRPDYFMELSKPDTIIVDEAHKAKDTNTKSYKALAGSAHKAPNFIGMTGSIVSNHPKEVVPLLDLVNNTKLLGSTAKFKKQHVKRKEVRKGGFLKPPAYRNTLVKRPKLKLKLKPVIHYVGHEELGASMPRLKITDKFTPMSDEQTKLYNFALGRLTPAVRRKIRKGLPVNQTEASHIFATIQKAREASNTVGAHKQMTSLEAVEQTPKLKAVVDDVVHHLKTNKDGQALVYSNFKASGAKLLQEGLKAKGVNSALISGDVKPKDRDKIVRDFKAGKYRAAVLTPASNEGVSFDNATFFAEVDRHYNPERNMQAIARGRRIGGQSNRPLADRELKVNRYFSVPKANWFSRLLHKDEVGIDQWIGDTAKEKSLLNEQFRDTINR